MRWNWQLPEWPHFDWEPERLLRAEERFLLTAGSVQGVVRHLGDDDRDRLAVEAMCEEAITTARIEGEILDRASVQSSLQQALGVPADRRRSKPAEEGIAEMMVDVHRGFAAPLDEATLCRWHECIVRGRRDLREVGRYRTRGDPMQVVSGRLDAPTIHFEAPPAAIVPREMSRFVDWFNRTAPDGSGPLPAITRAGLAHLHFESIHPFEDGNGRVGRAIVEKALAQSLGRPTLASAAATILARQGAYYRELEAANRTMSVTRWLAWFAATCLEAQLRAVAHTEFLIDKTRLLDRLRGAVNARQEAAILRMLREGPTGFVGGLSAGKYVAITKASPATATRDLAELVALNALERTGERRHARYRLTIPLRPVPQVEIADDGTIVEHAPE
jgi:Fic family protein